jgi:hypothetical protein
LRNLILKILALKGATPFSLSVLLSAPFLFALHPLPMPSTTKPPSPLEDKIIRDIEDCNSLTTHQIAEISSVVFSRTPLPWEQVNMEKFVVTTCFGREQVAYEYFLQKLKDHLYLRQRELRATGIRICASFKYYQVEWTFVRS